MAKRIKPKKKAAAAPKKPVKKVSSKLEVDVKVGILHTVAKAIYATPVGKIREAVANSIDNRATWIVAAADPTTNTLCLYDNGGGITRARFQEILKSIGYGLLAEDQQRRLSYFGLGLMSIFQLGSTVKIFTRSIDEGEDLVLEVDANGIFDSEKKDESISVLRECFTLRDVEKGERHALDAPSLDVYLDQKLGGEPESFTEIIIERVKPADFNTICSPKFVDELRKELPLKVEPNEPFLKQFSGNRGKQIKKLLRSNNFCPTIDVHFGVRGSGIMDESAEPLEHEDEIRQLWKYFPRFRSDLKFDDKYVLFSDSEEDDFAYYFVHTIAQDLHRQKEDERENGFWIRNQNFLVKAADFLERPGPGARIISPPLRNWIFGEVFHKNMNEFLMVSRKEFLFDENLFLQFRESVKEIVKPLEKRLRKIWEEKNRIVEKVIKPFEQMDDPMGPLSATEKRLRQLVGEEVSEKDFTDEMFDRLKTQRKLKIEDDDARIDRLLTDDKEAILLGENENIDVVVEPGLKEIEGNYQVSWDEASNKVVVSIAPALFSPRKVIFLNRPFDLMYVAKKEEDPGVSINIDDKKIYVNPFNKELSIYSLSILDVLIALDVAEAMSDTPKECLELKENFLSLIGVKSPDVYDFVAPLGAELRRSQAFSR